MRITKLLAVAAATALIAAGCGDDDDSTTSPTTTPGGGPTGSITREQWVTQADRICAQADRATQQAAQQQFGDEAPTDAQLNEFGDTVVAPSLQSQHDAIAQLPKPAGDEERIDEMLARLQEGIEAISDDPSLLVQGADSVSGIARATEVARELGLSDCGSG